MREIVEDGWEETWGYTFEIDVDVDGVSVLVVAWKPEGNDFGDAKEAQQKARELAGKIAESL